MHFSVFGRIFFSSRILDASILTLTVAPYITVLISFLFSTRRIQATTKKRCYSSYFDSGWNILDLCSYAMVVGAVAVSRVYDRETEPAVNVVSGCTIIVLSFQFLNFLRAFEWSGSLVRMMTQIISDMFAFCMPFKLYF